MSSGLVKRGRPGTKNLPRLSNSDTSNSSDSDSDDQQNSSTSSDSDYSSTEEYESDKIQQIVGVKILDNDQTDDDTIELQDIPPDKIRYFVKWAHKSHIHDSVMTENELLDVPGGDVALKKFKNRSIDGLSKSHSCADVFTAYYEDMNDSWTKVDRLLAKDEDGDWLVKWRSLPYEESTWESPEDIPDFDECEAAYHKRRSHGNPIKYDPRKPRPNGNFVPLKSSPKLQDGTELRDYQLNGVNWLLNSYYERCNSILADEMGLGKTVQIVVTLEKIAELTGITGPFLVISPLSTLQQWRREFEKWSPLNPVVFHGKPASREIILKYEFPTDDGDDSMVGFDVLITNYETFVNEFDTFNRIQWRYLVLDEGHRLKNHTGKCYQLLENLKYEHCTLLTGTPIQNNVEELWSLLHLLHPTEFDDLPNFMEQFGHIEDVATLQALQEIIRPYILRRKKSDVEATLTALEETIIEVELTRIQKMYYTTLLHENAGVLMQQITGGSLPSLQNLMMQLRKVCNHPFLIKGAQEYITQMVREKAGSDESEDDIQERAIVESSGKMILIDKLLPKLRNDGHKVLIFSQMVKVLDIIEEYLAKKEIQWERIDGNVPEPERNAAIERFATDDDVFVFLLCTRAGGVGINLTAADTVVIYDSDWNPQNDVQAQARCHRIGQTQDVKVYRLVTRGTYELEMLDRASRKLGLEQALLDGCEMSKSEPVQASEIEKLLRYGAYNILKQDDSESDKFISQDIDQILNSRTKDRKKDISGKSLFSKTVFDIGEEDKNSEIVNQDDFWVNILPEESAIKTLDERQCRRKKTAYVDSEESESEEEKTTRNEAAQNKKKGVSMSVRVILKKMNRFGLSDSAYEKAILYAAATFSLNLNDSDIDCICDMLGIASLSDPSEEIVEALDKFASNLNDVQERYHLIVRRCLLFYRLTPIIRKLQGHVSRWPSNDSCDPVEDYAFLLGIFRNGICISGDITKGINYHEIKITSTRKLEQKLGWLVSSLGEILKDEPMPELPDPPPHPVNDSAENTSKDDKNASKDDKETSKDDKSTSKDDKETSKEDKETSKEDESKENGEEEEQSESIVRPEFRGDEMLPEEWKLHHQNLYNREELSSEEMISLFQTLHSFGVALDDSGEVDWDKIIKLSRINGVSKDIIKQVGTEMLILGTKSNDEAVFNEEIEKFKDKLSNYSTRMWFRKLNAAVQDLEKVRRFVKNYTADQNVCLQKIKQFNAADWWTTEHDIALLKALSEYGQLFVTTWIMREDFPFRSLIPENLIDDFEKCAKLESEKCRMVKPNDCGPLAFLYKDKLKITRAITVVKGVEAMIGRMKVPEEPKPKKVRTNDQQKVRTVRLQKVAGLKIDSTNSLPLVSINNPVVLIPNQLILYSLGSFSSLSATFPIDYTARVIFYSVVTPTSMQWYEEKTGLDPQGRIYFYVKMLADNFPEFIDFDPNAVWQQIVSKIRSCGFIIEDFNGADLFGFTNPSVIVAFQRQKATLQQVQQIYSADSQKQRKQEMQHTVATPQYTISPPRMISQPTIPPQTYQYVSPPTFSKQSVSPVRAARVAVSILPNSGVEFVEAKPVVEEQKPKVNDTLIQPIVLKKSVTDTAHQPKIIHIMKQNEPKEFSTESEKAELPHVTKSPIVKRIVVKK